MQVVCFNLARAQAHLEKTNDAATAALLITVLKEHAVEDSEISIFSEKGNVTHMTFTSTHEVDMEIEADDTVISIHTEQNDQATATVSSSNTSSSKAKTMNTENSNNASATQQAAPQQQPAAAPAAEDNTLALKIGKGVLYVAGAGAAIAAGVWAWKKWGSSSSSNSSTTTV